MCVLATTPVTTCTVTVPRLSTVSLVAAEPDGAVFVRLTPQSPQDTVRDGRYVEFTGWTECDDRAERGLCVIRPSSSVTIEGNFQLMQQVTIYQTGAARMEYRLYSAGPTLKVPAENYNILDYAGCQRDLIENLWSIHGFPVRLGSRGWGFAVPSVHRVRPTQDDRGHVPHRWTRDGVRQRGWGTAS